MKILIFILIFVGFNYISFSQERRIVMTLKLNVRSGAGISYKIINQVEKNDTILVLGKKKAWMKIALENEEIGYVSSKFLSEPLSEIKNSTTSQDSKSRFWEIVIFVVFIIIFLIVIINGYSSRCPNCRKWWSTKVDNSIITSQNEGYQTVTRYDTNYNNQGKQIGTTKRKEQIKVRYDQYLNYHSCKKCFHKWTTTSYITIEL